MPIMVNFVYAAVLNATEQTLFCCGLVRSLSPQLLNHLKLVLHF